MPQVKFESGQIVNFATMPTQKDIDEVATKLGINKPAPKQSFLSKAGSFFTEGKGLKALTDTFISPVARELERPIVSAVRGVQGLVPGGKTGRESVETPFGEVKPLSELSPGEALGGAVEVASFLPLEKLFIGGAKLAGKFGRSLLRGTGEVLTGVAKSKLDDFYKLAKNAPEEVERLKDIVSANPSNPFLGLAENIGSSINDLKKVAKTTFDSAIESVKTQFPNTSFNLANKLPEINKTLNEFRLSVKQSREAGKFISSGEKVVVEATTRTTPWTKQEVDKISELVRKLSVKDMTLDELLDFDASVKTFFDEAVRKDNKKLIALAGRLVEDSTKFIDDVLPEVNEANQLYKDYYSVLKKLGNKIVDSKGNIKTSAEGFLSNINNLNKGEIRDLAQDVSRTLGINITKEVQGIKNIQSLSELVPNTTRNRTMDIIRGIVGSKAFAGGAGVGIAVNPTVAIPALILNIMSSPKTYAGLIEVIAGASKKLPVTEAIKKLSPDEIILLQQLIKGGGRSLKSDTEQ